MHAPLSLLLLLLLWPSLLRAQPEPPPPEVPSSESAPPSPPAAFQPPKLVHFVEAELSSELAGDLASREAEVLLNLDVDEAGKVTQVAVERSGGPGFDEAAVAAAKQFVFEPATQGQKPVPSRVTYRYRFVQRAVTPPPTPTVSPVPFSGVVLRRGDRVPLAGVDVALDEGDGTLTTVTGARGEFRFDEVTPGPHKVHLRGATIGALDVPVTLHAGKRLEVTYYVAAKEQYATTVRTRRVVQETVEQSIPIEEVRRIPGTQGDTIKAIQNLPGVARPPFNGGLVVVWGSGPNDTRTYVDGVFIPTLFHFSGLRSTVNSELVQSLTLLPGGYGADYGRGLGGVVEIESRAPRTDGYHGFAQIDLIDISAGIEGPITDKLSFSVAGRVSWINLFLPAFLTSDVQTSPRYWDYQAKLRWRPTSRDDVDFFAFGSDDRLTLLLKDPDPTLTQAFDTHTYYHRVLGRWTHRFANRATFTLTPSVGYDLPYNLGVGLGSSPFLIQNGQIEYNLRALARIPLTSWLRIDAGLDYEGTRYTLNATQNVDGGLREGDNGGFGGLGGPDATRGVATDRLLLYTNHTAPHAALTFELLGKRLILRPQVRFETLSFSGYPGTPRAFTRSAFLPEPRITVRYQVHPKVSLDAAVGVYHQPAGSADLSAVFGNPRLLPQYGVHYVLGVKVNVTSTLHIEAQGFYKELRDLVVRGITVGSPPLTSDGIGRAYGGEVLVRQSLWKNFFGWVSYTFSRSERRDHPELGTPWRRFQYDQTHILTLIASYKLPYGFQVGLRFRYATGNPYTPVVRSYFDSNSGNYIPIFGQTYSGRLPSFNQLDLRVDKTFTFKRWRLVAYLDIENLYAARTAETAVFNYNYKQVAFVNGLPFLPVIGVRGEF